MSITAARGRRLVKYRNCFCGRQAEKFMDGSFLCCPHWELDRQRYFQAPAETAANIRRSNIESEKRRYARLKESGMCVTCAKQPSYFGCIRCVSCQEKRRILNRKSKGKPLPAALHPWKAANHAFFSPSSLKPEN